MTNFLDTTAWIRIKYDGNHSTTGVYDYLYLTAEEWDYDNVEDGAVVIDNPNRGHFGFAMLMQKVGVKIKNIYVTNEADWNILKKQLAKVEDSDTATIRIQISSTPTYELFDGTTDHDEMPIIIEAKNGFKKIYKGDATVYQIGLIKVRQIGDLT